MNVRSFDNDTFNGSIRKRTLRVAICHKPYEYLGGRKNSNNNHP
jgi:hypothetical protein